MLERRKFLKMGVLSVVSTGLVLGSARIGLAQKSGAGRTFESSADLPIEAQQDPVFSFKVRDLQTVRRWLFRSSQRTWRDDPTSADQREKLQTVEECITTHSQVRRNRQLFPVVQGSSPVTTFYFDTQDQTSFPG